MSEWDTKQGDGGECYCQTLPIIKAIHHKQYLHSIVMDTSHPGPRLFEPPSPSLVIELTFLPPPNGPLKPSSSYLQLTVCRTLPLPHQLLAATHSPTTATLLHTYSSLLFMLLYTHAYYTNVHTVYIYPKIYTYLYCCLDCTYLICSVYPIFISSCLFCV